MPLIEMYDVANAPSFKNRLISCIVATAGNVFTEDPSSMSDTVHQKRVVLAQAVVMDPIAQAQRFVWPILSNPVIANEGIEVGDDALMYQAAQVWNTVAGVTASDSPEP